MPEADYRVDALRGRVLIDPGYSDKYLRVDFTAGYTPGDPEDLEGTPQWQTKPTFSAKESAL
jgi:hypothetical protein